MPAQDRLDFAQLDAEATDLDLVILAAEEIEVAVAVVAGQVPRFVEALTRRIAMGVGDEAGRACRRTPEVSPRQPRSGDVELACRTDGHGPQGTVQEHGADVLDRPADRHTGAVQARHSAERPMDRTGHRGLGGTVDVEEP